MWADGGGIADNLSREFRAMSSERDRRWGTERGGGGRAIAGASTPVSGFTSSRARSSPLRYGGGGSWGRAGARTYEPVRRYSRSDDVAFPPRADRTRYSPVRALSGMAPGEGRHVRGSRWEDSGDESSYSYSYSSAYSSDSEASSSDGYDDGARGRRGQHHPQHSQQQRPHRSQRAPLSERGQPSHVVRYTPTGPTGAVDGGAPLRWVGGGERSEEGPQRRGGGGGQPDGGYDGRVAVMNPTDPQRPMMAQQMPALQPSGLLQRVVEAVAFYRGVPAPAAIPSEVTLAFDEYVSLGSTMLKFLPHGPPHARYFTIRFLDVVPGGVVVGTDPRQRELTVPHAVLGWFRNTSSRHMIRFLPLHDLMEVRADGADHPYVKRRMVQPGLLRGPRNGLSTNYVYADFVLQFRFRSRLSSGQESLALKAANRTQHLAWLVVGSFISQIGFVAPASQH